MNSIAIDKKRVNALKNAETWLIELIKARDMERKGSVNGRPPFACIVWVNDRKANSIACSPVP